MMSLAGVRDSMTAGVRFRESLELCGYSSSNFDFFGKDHRKGLNSNLCEKIRENGGN
ncbi:MAG: hypothetical protein ACPLM9_03530 [Methanomassiliicoccales archaeon]